jgi:hypothetical protein
MHKAVQNIINKTLIQPFYKQHLIILGLVYLIMFGAVRGDQLITYHLKLIEGTVSSYGAMALVFAIWFLYFIRTIYFLVQQITTKEFGLLQQLCLIPTRQYPFALLQIVTLCLLPISSYGVCVVVWAFTHGFIVKGFIVLLFQMAVHAISFMSLHKHLQNVEYRFIKTYNFTSKLKLRKKYPVQLYIKYLFTQQAIPWLLIKLVCMMTIKAVFHSESPNDELRFSSFFYVLLFMMHVHLVHSFVQWKHTQFWHIRMLGLSAFYKYSQAAIFLILLIVPEIVWIGTAYPVHLTAHNAMAMVLLSIATLLFIFSISIAFHNELSNYSPLLFLYLLLCYGFILADAVSVFSVVVIIASCIVYIVTSKELELTSKEK